jgi:hypothetical protein
VGEGVAELRDQGGEQAEHRVTLGSDRIMGPHRCRRRPSACQPATCRARTPATARTSGLTPRRSGSTTTTTRQTSTGSTATTTGSSAKVCLDKERRARRGAELSRRTSRSQRFHAFANFADGRRELFREERFTIGADGECLHRFPVPLEVDEVGRCDVDVLCDGRWLLAYRSLLFWRPDGTAVDPKPVGPQNSFRM